MNRPVRSTILAFLLCASVFSGVANAAWIWTPETKKFTNPKNAVKDTPKEQFEWAMGFYNAKDYQRAAFEFEKLAKQYEFSDYASKAQYYVGLCYEDMQKYYTAYENYQKAIDNFPHLSNTDEVLAREYAIGILYLEKPGPKVMGTDIMAPLDRAVEIFKKVVDNAPYGKYAEDAQLKLGEALKKSERYEEAIQAYHKISEDYPNSKYATQAMYEESYCAYKASLKPAYDATATDSAIKTFEKFVDKNKDAELARKADSTMKRLKDNVAQKSFDVAKFYESQDKTEAAVIYYQDVIDTYPESSLVNEAKARIGALKNKGVKKAPSPSDSDKKKQESLTGRSQKKLSWNLFGLTGKKQEEIQAPQGLPKEAQKKKGWRPFSFETKKEIRQTQTPPAAKTPKVEVQAKAPEAPKTEATPPTVQAPKTEPVVPAVEAPKMESPAAPALEAPKQEKPVEKKAVKKKAWTPFDFESKKEKKAEKSVEKKPVEKKPWKPFSFFSSKKTEEAAPKIKEAPKKKAWTPFRFEDKKKKKSQEVKVPTQEAPAIQAPKAEPAAPVAEPVAPVTQIVEKIKVESGGQVLESTKTEPMVQATEAQKTEPAAQIVEAPKQEEPAPQAKEAPKKKGWTPFNFEGNKEKKAGKSVEKKPWKPFNFSNSTFGLLDDKKMEESAGKK